MQEVDLLVGQDVIILPGTIEDQPETLALEFQAKHAALGALERAQQVPSSLGQVHGLIHPTRLSRPMIVATAPICYLCWRYYFLTLAPRSPRSVPRSAAPPLGQSRPPAKPLHQATYLPP